jgi:hypothetical protein
VLQFLANKLNSVCVRFIVGIHQHWFLANVPCRSTRQTLAAGLHHPHSALDFRSIIQSEFESCAVESIITGASCSNGATVEHGWHVLHWVFAFSILLPRHPQLYTVSTESRSSSPMFWPSLRRQKDGAMLVVWKCQLN